MHHLSKDEKEKMLMKLKFKKIFFLKNFIIGYVLVLIAFMISMFMYDSGLSMCQRMFGISSDLYGLGYFLIFGIWKVLLYQFSLVPFLSAYLMERHLKAHE